MQIESHQQDEFLQIHVEGRLDAENAMNLEKTMEEAIHSGDFKIKLEMGMVTYLSSAGLRVLLKFSQMLKNYSGSFQMINVSPAVQNVLEMTGMSKTMLAEQPEQVDSAEKQKEASGRDFIDRTINNMNCSLFEMNSSDRMTCTFEGHPERLRHCAFSYRDHHVINCDNSDLIALGLGTIGPDQEEFHRRCGEFMAVSGIAMYQPTNGGNIPDYMIASGKLTPRIHAPYSLQFQGAPQYCLRFEAKSLHVTTTEVLDTLLELAKTEAVGMVMLAQSHGLIGAMLRQPPFDNLSDFFAFPGIRERLSFSTEHVDNEKLVIIAGAAGQKNNQNGIDIQTFTRPWNDRLWGHLHAAVFNNRMLPQGRLDMKSTLNHLFHDRWPLKIMHLINDTREICGAGDSLFSKGAVWFSPLSEITRRHSVASRQGVDHT